ncbi:putative lipoprotein [Pseudomonas chlororaphis O6]|uniref:Lipoprotein n=1 Tax=Pseudomonas chlororaphis O6 TaxID=1037915 RepID=A0AB33WVZ1_9PSED|nr:putative lipoprotein [Pseudomonas chlororaphis O6]
MKTLGYFVSHYGFFATNMAGAFVFVGCGFGRSRVEGEIVSRRLFNYSFLR